MKVNVSGLGRLHLSYYVLRWPLSLLQVAKINLRKADRASTLSRIYFDPDLTPAEREQAYLRRKERRENGTNAISTIYSSLSTSCLICHCCHAAPLSVSVLTLHAMCKISHACMECAISVRILKSMSEVLIQMPL